jgi:hypothetical protein
MNLGFAHHHALLEHPLRDIPRSRYSASSFTGNVIRSDFRPANGSRSGSNAYQSFNPASI